ncbi:MAG: ComEC/Rec2 family competence protein [Gammaproteobacteria bacterium]|uniref:ComEC/Rec2 family competence protein n=1 Tax=Bradyrhizobium sp. TaxID=376 RepID=UPI003D0B72BA
MADYFEIDFLGVETNKSGDAIPLRYELMGQQYIHVVDGGFQDTGRKVVDHIREFYGNPSYIDHVVVTHPDGDHAGGVRTVLEEFNVGTLWMLRPWLYSAALLPRFARFSTIEGLSKRLREIYSSIDAVEKIANARGINIAEPFQGKVIGAFSVLAPTPARYLDLIVESDRTPESVENANKGLLGALAQGAGQVASTIRKLIQGAWGHEIFSPNETSAENEMSVIQYANLCNKRILLTADAGREALTEAAAFAEACGLVLPGIDRFQVPHHGSRRNVSTEVLDRWLGPRLAAKPAPGDGHFQAIVSSAKLDEAHPRKSVVRAMIHRGANVYCTESVNIWIYQNAPARGWGNATPASYPEDQEA